MNALSAIEKVTKSDSRPAPAPLPEHARMTGSKPDAPADSKSPILIASGIGGYSISVMIAPASPASQARWAKRFDPLAAFLIAEWNADPRNSAPHLETPPPKP